VAAPAADPVPVPVDRAIAQDRNRMDPAGHAGPCTRLGPSPAELQARAVVLVLAHRVPALVLVLVLAHPGQAPVAQPA